MTEDNFKWTDELVKEFMDKYNPYLLVCSCGILYGLGSYLKK